MKKSREELEQELAEATTKLEQYQHQQQRLENRIHDYREREHSIELLARQPHLLYRPPAGLPSRN